MFVPLVHCISKFKIYTLTKECQVRMRDDRNVILIMSNVTG